MNKPMKIYRAIDNTDGDPISILLDHQSSFYDSIAEVGIGDVTLDELAWSMDSALENVNHHSVVGMGEYLAQKFIEFVGEERAKELFWAIVQDKGFDWEF